MSSEAAANADFSRIRYAQCWEDADVLLDALDVQPGDTCLSIASAGDNSLALLSLPAVAIEVGGAANQATTGRLPINWPILAAGIAGLLVLILILWLARHWLRTLPWQWLLEPMARAVKVLRSLRQPVLPTRLNPDSSAAD